MALALARSPAAWINTDVSTAFHIARQDRAPASRAGRYALAGTAVLLTVLGLAAGVVALRGSKAVAAADPLAARVARLEAALAEAQDIAARRGVPTAPTAQAAPPAQADRFIAAALLLQSAVATPRPWLREYQVMVALAPPGALPAPLAEVLLSHAVRGLPTEAELRERYAVLAPQLAARAPRQGDAFDQTFSAIRGAASAVGLAAAPPPTDQEQAIAGVAQQLRRGNLAAAVADAAALAPVLQPLLSGWLAQARARLAVEQAVQETLLRALVAQVPPA
jgi:hypothetical protein